MGTYEVPISFSFASTTTSSAANQAGTTFNFSSPGASGGNPTNLSEPNAPATATSSAALGGNATSSAAGTGVNTPLPGYSGSSSGLLSSPVLLIGLAVAAFLVYKHMKGGA